MEERKIIFDFSKLKGRIKEKVGNQKDMAEKLGISNTTFSSKINNNIDFTNSETQKMINILEIPLEKINDYFFTYQVALNATKKENTNGR